MTAVRCVDLCKTYHQGDEEIKALDHVSIDIDEGGFVCLSAPSGGGKTTLLNAIGGLDKPDSGEIYIAGRRIDNLGKGELAELRLRQIGFVFQAFNLIPVLTARENVEFVMQVQGVPSGDRGKLALEILEEVGLAKSLVRTHDPMLTMYVAFGRVRQPAAPAKRFSFPISKRTRHWAGGPGSGFVAAFISMNKGETR